MSNALQAAAGRGCRWISTVSDQCRRHPDTSATAVGAQVRRIRRDRQRQHHPGNDEAGKPLTAAPSFMNPCGLSRPPLTMVWPVQFGTIWLSPNTMRPVSPIRSAAEHRAGSHAAGFGDRGQPGSELLARPGTRRCIAAPPRWPWHPRPANLSRTLTVPARCR